MNWDFHCHSSVSDGLLPPAQVVARAAANGVDLLALTDHDAIDGLAAADAAAREAGIRLLPGVEISIEWQGTPIHIVGLGIDASCAVLVEGLASLREGRTERARRMSAALEKVGIPGAFEGALRYAANPSLVSRAHFARFLVEHGVCDEVKRVFDRYLVPGKPGYVEHQWATLADATGWIAAAGGIAVVAHPARYKLTNGATRRFLEDFIAHGGQGIEVVCGSHTPDNVRQFARLATDLGLYASRGSDFHGPEESVVDLGRMPELPAGQRPVLELL
ncbi:MAG TPA: 3',5'-nucleoside bisphosphate phosphatase [Rhodocyclaceae bacterium]